MNNCCLLMSPPLSLPINSWTLFWVLVGCAPFRRNRWWSNQESRYLSLVVPSLRLWCEAWRTSHQVCFCQGLDWMREGISSSLWFAVFVAGSFAVRPGKPLIKVVSSKIFFGWWGHLTSLWIATSMQLVENSLQVGDGSYHTLFNSATGISETAASSVLLHLFILMCHGLILNLRVPDGLAA